MTTYVYNEHDENQVLTMRNKLKKKKRKSNRNESENHLERNKKTESSADLVSLYCIIWCDFLLFAIGRMADGFPELPSQGWTSAFSVCRIGKVPAVVF